MAPEERGQIVVFGLATSLVVLPYYSLIGWLVCASALRAWRHRADGMGPVLRDEVSWRSLLVLAVAGPTVWWVLQPLRSEMQRAMEVAGRRPQLDVPDESGEYAET